ncbi:MAG TPA: hypothetical protein VMA37_04235 [Acetobacteraceae bacterium]|nr:hypothetical protein [Acetobacteraceae bacterium]
MAISPRNIAEYARKREIEVRDIELNRREAETRRRDHGHQLGTCIRAKGTQVGDPHAEHSGPISSERDAERRSFPL